VTVTLTIGFPLFLWTTWAVINMVAWGKVIAHSDGPLNPIPLMTLFSAGTAFFFGFIHMGYALLSR